MRSSAFLAAGLLGALALGPAQAIAAPTAVSITSPAAGATISRAANPALDVAGTAAFDTAAVAAAKTFYLRGTGCGTTEDLWLSITKGTDEYDGCGIIGGLPLNEVLDDPKLLSARDGLPVKVDGSKPLTGTIRAESWIGNGVPGVGQVVVDVAISGTDAGDNFVDLGSATVQTLNTGTEGVMANFSIDIPDEADGAVLKGLDLAVSVHGANYNSSNLGMDGDSKFVLPVLDEGSVQVSDSPTFPAARTRTALVEGGTWATSLATPGTGAQTIYARAQQGTARLSAAPVAITVTP